MSMLRLHTRKSAFSLIEISIVLAVISVVLAGLLPMIVESTRATDSRTTLERMDAIEEALSAYVYAYGRLPCPANNTAAITSTNFGAETGDADGDTDCSEGSLDANWQSGTGATDVAYGGVPTRALNLPDEYGLDGWGRRLNYMVSSANLDDASLASLDDGAITINPSRTTKASYALWSSGENGHGGYTIGGGRYNAGVTNTNELDNCACNSSAAAATQDATLVMQIHTGQGASAFDDIMRYKTKEQLQIAAGGISSSGSGAVGPTEVDTAPSDVTITTATHNGNFGGYQAMNTWIQSNGCSGYNVCTADDLARYSLKNGAISPASVAWFAEGANADVAGTLARDCEGWKSSSGAARGQIWSTGNIPAGNYCNVSNPVMCCKPAQINAGTGTNINSGFRATRSQTGYSDSTTYAYESIGGTYTEAYDDGNDFDTGTGIFTVPETGKYIVGGSVHFNPLSTSANLFSAIEVNGSPVARGSRGGSSTRPITIVNQTLNLTAGDQVQLAYYSDSAPSSTSFEAVFFASPLNSSSTDSTTTTGWSEISTSDTNDYDTSCEYRITTAGGTVHYPRWVTTDVFVYFADNTTYNYQIPKGEKNYIDRHAIGSSSPANDDWAAVAKIEKNCATSGSGGVQGLVAVAGGASIPNNTTTTLTSYGTIVRNDFDSGIFSGGVFTVPSGGDGWYQISGYARMSGGQTDLFVELQVNSSTLAAQRDVSDTDGSDAFVGVSTAHYLSASDTVHMAVAQQSGSTKTLHTGRFSIVKIPESAGGSSSGDGSSSMVSGWPDAIICTVSSDKIALYLQHGPAADGLYYYTTPSPTSSYRVKFNADGSFNGYDTFTSSDCNKSITDLYSAGQAFNFVSGTSDSSSSNVVGNVQTRAVNTDYNDTTDGIVTAAAYCTTSSSYGRIYGLVNGTRLVTDVCDGQYTPSSSDEAGSISFPVRAGDVWRVTSDNMGGTAPSTVVHFHPISSNGGGSSAGVTTGDITVTVGASGDFTTINDALTHLTANYAPGYKSGGFTATVSLLAGFTMAEQVDVKGVDLGWITITHATGATTTITRSALTTSFDMYGTTRYPAFMAREGATLPVINALFTMDSSGASTQRNGITVYENSRAIIKSGMGVTNAGTHGLHVSSGSRAVAEGANFSGSGDSAVVVGRASTASLNSVNVSGAGGNGVFVSESSTVDMREANASGVGARGIYALYGALVNANNANLSSSGSDCMIAHSGSTINANNATANNCGSLGVYAIYGSRINFNSGSAQYTSNSSIYALYGSHINANHSTSDSNGSGQHCLYSNAGSHIAAHGATTNSCSGYGYAAGSGSTISVISGGGSDTGSNISTDTFTGSGIIWR